MSACKPAEARPFAVGHERSSKTAGCPQIHAFSHCAGNRSVGSPRRCLVSPLATALSSFTCCTDKRALCVWRKCCARSVRQLHVSGKALVFKRGGSEKLSIAFKRDTAGRLVFAAVVNGRGMCPYQRQNSQPIHASSFARFTAGSLVCSRLSRGLLPALFCAVRSQSSSRCRVGVAGVHRLRAENRPTMAVADQPCYTLLNIPTDSEPPNEMQLRNDLEKGDMKTKAEALRKTIQLMLNGEKYPSLLMTIIRFVLPLQDHTLKKAAPHLLGDRAQDKSRRQAAARR
ncbi:hypothetical protein MRX96_033699 [Rhipicephalus microplus]